MELTLEEILELIAKEEAAQKALEEMAKHDPVL